MNRLRITTVFCIIFLSSAVLIPFANADWPMFRSDPSHDGVGTGNAVLTPQLLWKSTIANSSTGGYVGSSPAVVDGIVYVGSAVGAVPVGQSISPSSTTDAVYALNAKSGVELWNYSTGSLGVSSCPAVVGGVLTPPAAV